MIKFIDKEAIEVTEGLYKGDIGVDVSITGLGDLNPGEELTIGLEGSILQDQIICPRSSAAAKGLIVTCPDFQLSLAPRECIILENKGKKPIKLFNTLSFLKFKPDFIVEHSGDLLNLPGWTIHAMPRGWALGPFIDYGYTGELTDYVGKFAGVTERHQKIISYTSEKLRVLFDRKLDRGGNKEGSSDGKN